MAKGGRGQRARKTKREAAGKTKERTRERGRVKELRKRDGESREGEWDEDWGAKKGGGCERRKEEEDEKQGRSKRCIRKTWEGKKVKQRETIGEK